MRRSCGLLSPGSGSSTCGAKMLTGTRRPLPPGETKTEDLPVQEEELDAHQQLPRDTVLAWMQMSQAAEEANSSGFAVGRALRG